MVVSNYVFLTAIFLQCTTKLMEGHAHRRECFSSEGCLVERSIRGKSAEFGECRCKTAELMNGRASPRMVTRVLALPCYLLLTHLRDPQTINTLPWFSVKDQDLSVYDAVQFWLLSVFSQLLCHAAWYSPVLCVKERTQNWATLFKARLS